MTDKANGQARPAVPAMDELTGTGEPNPSPAGDAKVPPPVITITFHGPGQADMTIATAGNVQLSQLMAAAYLLDCVTREARAGDMARRAMGQLALPGGQLPPELRRMLGG